MAEIAPFRGILYDPSRAGPAERLLAPPYDVISEAERAHLAALSPYNAVHLILPEGAGDEKYANAARLLEDWMAGGVLARDRAPAFYRYHQTFTVEGRATTRKGFIGRVRLRRFDEGVVLPHERTLAGPKADRLKLKRAVRAHLSQVFGLYSDPEQGSDRIFTALEAEPPALAATTPDGVEHKLWRLTDRRAQVELERLLGDKKIYIADGHHRYETMLALREELRRETSNSRSSIEYGSLFLSNMDDPGLLVLPTHRVVHGLQRFERAALLERARQSFNVDERPLGSGAGEAAEVRRVLAGKGREGPSFALATSAGLAYLTLRPDANLERVLAGPAVLRRLDVTLLHALVLEAILGIDRAAQAAQTNLRYVKDTDQALKEARAPGVQAVFLMNPTKVSEVKAVADAGEVMPQKSTFFYPKLASGLVLNPLIPSEEV